MKNISVIIAAKNEEENLPFLIDSLSKIDYPKEHFEIIIVDDKSSDNTFEAAKLLTRELSNCRILEAADKKYEGKRGALEEGISNSNYEFILITDADCRPEADWLTEYSNKFQEGYEFLFGVAPFIQKKSIANKIACFDNLRTHILTFFFAETGNPYSAAARNFGFNKDSFNKIGGYKNTQQTKSGDDDLLLREAVKHKMRIGAIKEKGSFVYSKSKESLKEYFKQKARHVSTSNFYLLKTKIAVGSWHLVNIFLLFSPLLIFISELFLIPLIIKILFDVLTVKIKQKEFGYSFKMSEIIYLQIIYETFLIVHYIYGSIAKPRWK